MNAEELKAAGFNDNEISEYINLKAAGFSDKEIDDFYTSKTTPKPSEKKGVIPRLISGAGSNLMDLAKTGLTLGKASADLWAGEPQGVIDLVKGVTQGAQNFVIGAGGLLRKGLGMEENPYATQEQREAGKESMKPFTNPIDYAIENPINTALALLPGYRAAKEIIVGKNTLDLTAKLNSVIDTGFAKGVKPLKRKGQSTIAGAEHYQNASREVVKDIIANKIDLPELPRNAVQMVDAIDRGLTRNARLYLEEVEKMTGQGINTPLSKVIVDLRKFINDPVSRKSNPVAVRYAENRIKDFHIDGDITKGIDSLNPSDWERLLQSQTSVRKELLANPSKDIDRLHVEGIINKSLRETQDALMNQYDAPNYRPFKDKYAYYKQVEADVIGRARQTSRQGPYSLIDFSDVYTLPQIIGNLVVGNIGGAAKAALSKGIASYIKWANKSDTAIHNMFRQTSSIMDKMPKGERFIPEKTTGLFDPLALGPAPTEMPSITPRPMIGNTAGEYFGRYPVPAQGQSLVPFQGQYTPFMPKTQVEISLENLKRSRQTGMPTTQTIPESTWTKLAREKNMRPTDFYKYLIDEEDVFGRRR